MFNKKTKSFESRKEQKYLKNLIEKIDNPFLKKIYLEFENITSHEELKNFIKKYKSYFPSIELDDKIPLNELKEKIAFEIIEIIFKKINS